MNNVNLIGRLTKDPVSRKTQTGKSVATFTLAVNGYRKDDTDFINCVAWEKTGEIVQQYAHKGSQIGVTGALKTRTYESEGKTVYVTEVLVSNVHLLDSKGESTKYVEDEPKNKPLDITDSDLPF